MMPLMINQKWNYPEVPFVVDLTFLTLYKQPVAGFHLGAETPQLVAEW